MKKNINILLTEVLPFELPYFLTNKPLISFLESMEPEKYIYYINKGYYDKTKATIPLNFYSYKNNQKKRILSIPHFISQLNFLFFLEKYNKVLLNYFSLNTFYSIRIPKKISNQTYRYATLQEHVYDILNNDLPPEVEEKIAEEKEYKNFYYNGKYSKLSSFYESSLVKKLEKQFNLVLKLDIKKCFYNIYTHSIDWAYLGDKKTAKKYKNSKERVSSILDSILQNANNAETNGIIVGPEFSRIAAEIVLSKIDNYLFLKLKENNLKTNKDYFIVRYIDDFYIFANNEEILKLIEIYLEEILEIFKLSINDSKKSIEHKPFFKEQFWVYKLSKGILDFYLSLSEKSNLVGYSEEAKIDYLKTRVINHIFMKLNMELKDLITNYLNNDYKIISYFLSTCDIEKIFQNIKNLSLNEDILNDLNLLITMKLIDLLTYIISFSLTATNIFKLLNLLIKLQKLELKEDGKEKIDFIIFCKIEELINYNIEKINEVRLLISFLKFSKFNIKQQIFIKILEKNNDYLTIVSILFYLDIPNRKNKQYKSLLKKINTILENKIKETDFEGNLFINTEYLYLYHDLSLNSSLDKIKELSESVKKIKNRIKKIAEENKEYEKIYKTNISFVDWNIDKYTFEQKIINKKYQSNSYD